MNILNKKYHNNLPLLEKDLREFSKHLPSCMFLKEEERFTYMCKWMVKFAPIMGSQDGKHEIFLQRAKNYFANFLPN